MGQIFTLKYIAEKPGEREEKKESMWVFMNLEKAYNKDNREALHHLLRMYYEDGNFFNEIKSIYVDSRAYVRVKGVSVSGSIVL